MLMMMKRFKKKKNLMSKFSPPLLRDVCRFKNYQNYHTKNRDNELGIRMNNKALIRFDKGIGKIVQRTNVQNGLNTVTIINQKKCAMESDEKRRKKRKHEI